MRPSMDALPADSSWKRQVMLPPAKWLLSTVEMNRISEKKHKIGIEKGIVVASLLSKEMSRTLIRGFYTWSIPGEEDICFYRSLTTVCDDDGKLIHMDQSDRGWPWGGASVYVFFPKLTLVVMIYIFYFHSWIRASNIVSIILFSLTHKPWNPTDAKCMANLILNNVTESRSDTKCNELFSSAIRYSSSKR